VGASTPAARPLRDDARFYQLDGRRLPSVTTILGVLAKPGLGPWYAKEERRHFETAMLEVASRSRVLTSEQLLDAVIQAVDGVKAADREKARAATIGAGAHALIEWHTRRMLGKAVGSEPTVPDAAAWAVEARRRCCRPKRGGQTGPVEHFRQAFPPTQLLVTTRRQAVAARDTVDGERGPEPFRARPVAQVCPSAREVPRRQTWGSPAMSGRGVPVVCRGRRARSWSKVDLLTALVVQPAVDPHKQPVMSGSPSATSPRATSMAGSWPTWATRDIVHLGFNWRPS
jgi:hypothetical protein